jgi:hypothetical protein
MYSGYGQTTSTQSTIIPNIQQLLTGLIKAGITQWKYKQAFKLAEKPCKTDPAHCGFYIAQAMRSLGLTPPPGIERLNLNQAKTLMQTPYLPSSGVTLPPPQPPTQSSGMLKWLLIGGGIIAAILLIKYLRRE